MAEVSIGQVWQNIDNADKVIVRDVTHKIVVAQNLVEDSMFFDTILHFIANYKLVRDNYLVAKA
ncbi:MAG: hypothetical protein WAQ98_10825 [Blastocatellia bacterium]